MMWEAFFLVFAFHKYLPVLMSGYLQSQSSCIVDANEQNCSIVQLLQRM